jgi:hypothetical protein
MLTTLVVALIMAVFLYEHVLGVWPSMAAKKIWASPCIHN